MEAAESAGATAGKVLARGDRSLSRGAEDKASGMTRPRFTSFGDDVSTDPRESKRRASSMAIREYGEHGSLSYFESAERAYVTM